MTSNNNIPTYSIRGINLCGFNDMDHFINYLFDGPQLKTGSLVAINAEKVLTMESQPEIAGLIGQAKYKYADSVRRAFCGQPQKPVLAGSGGAASAGTVLRRCLR